MLNFLELIKRLINFAPDNLNNRLMIDKKEQLLEAAEELFAEHGYEGTSTRMLAKKAGVNVAMVSYYFGSKEKLFEALVEDRAGNLREKLLELQDDNISPVKKIEMVIDYYVDRIFTNRRFHLILHREITLHQRLALNDSILNILLKNRKEVAKIIKDGQKKKVFKDVDVELTIKSIIGTITQVAHSPALSDKNASSETNKAKASKETLIKNRLKTHLKNMIKAHLLITKSHSK
jgi:AcrR family transcriptional regulator